jgi:GntR family transcriptional regulator
MHITWNDKDPIYRQLHDRLKELILEGVFPEGDALPSIREISGEHRINHITVAKSLQMLVDEELVEKRRGLGMFVKTGAQQKLLLLEKKKFLNEEWPAICSRIDRLGLSASELLARAKSMSEKKS